MQFYASPEQLMRDRSEFARKGIARGRSVVVLSYVGGVLFVAENPSNALHKVSEIYDRIGYAAVGKYNEFENLRQAVVRYADMRGYSYDRRDVTARGLVNALTQQLGAIFGEQSKPMEVEVCVAQVGTTPDSDELYRLTYDGSVGDEPGFVAMGGQAEAIATSLREKHQTSLDLGTALRLAVEALAAIGGENGKSRTLSAAQLEVAVLERARPGRAFRRLVGAGLERLLVAPEAPAADAPETDSAPADADADVPAEESAEDSAAEGTRGKKPGTGGFGPRGGNAAAAEQSEEAPAEPASEAAANPPAEEAPSSDEASSEGEAPTDEAPTDKK
jgi:proteasome alpha subunit